ncbi:VIR-like CYIR protein [Plasmodium cynomolgi strain B]|uniref:VIR-like CYIR protein n=1 Tax=Plasmodium cynomolgi (strain B) TaxID=1120755 RepID=K6UE09_PLACD|nr:VIR-like CYIR protein [Plasmodium cynomolgi strain B]GAB67531.1 VIR-like CYIR protein [Plasmodium cynomolgi strain B]
MEKDPKYKDLPSYIYYDKLNEDIIEEDDENEETVENEESEESEENVYWEAIEGSYEQTPWVRDVFFKLERNLTELNESRDEDSLSKKHCYDLNYWLYEQVYENLNNNENDENFFKIIDGLQDVWKNINNDKFPNADNLCHPDKTLIDMKYLKDVKHLFDLIEDFSTIKTAAIKDTNNACQKYIDYLKLKVPLYYEWNDVCTMEEENICTRYIDDYPKYNPKNVLENLSVVSLALASIFNDCYQNIINLFTEAEKIEPRTVLKHRGITGPSESNVVKIGGRALAEAISDTPQSGNMLIGINALATSLFSVVKRFNSYVFNLVAPVGLSLLSLLLFLYVLYKFTPIGKSINLTHKRVKNKFVGNRSDDFDDDEDDDDDDDSDNNSDLKSSSSMESLNSHS